MSVISEFQERALLSPILTEATTMIKEGVPENYAFCWAAVRLVDEVEAYKNIVAEQKKLINML